MENNSLADWSLGVKVFLCDVFVTCGWGGAYMPSFGMCAVIPIPRTMPSLQVVRGWRIHAVVWHVCGYCAPRTMPSLHVVRRHHKTTSAPPQKRDSSLRWE